MVFKQFVDHITIFLHGHDYISINNAIVQLILLLEGVKFVT